MYEREMCVAADKIYILDKSVINTRKYRKRFSPCCSVASLYFEAVAGRAIPELTNPALKERNEYNGLHISL